MLLCVRACSSGVCAEAVCRASLVASLCTAAQISDEERVALRAELQAVHDANPRSSDGLPVTASRVEDNNVLHIPYFKVKWVQAMDLVQHRRVLLRGGYAFVPRDKLVNLVISKFRTNVSAPRASCVRALALCFVSWAACRWLSAPSSCRTAWRWRSRHSLPSCATSG